MESTRPAQSTMNATPGTVTCSCGKVCKNQHGIRIHQGKSGYQRVRSRGKRLVSIASETTQEYSSQETTHSTEDLYIQEITHDVSQDPEMEYDPLLELLQEKAAKRQSKKLSRIDHTKILPLDPEYEDQVAQGI